MRRIFLILSLAAVGCTAPEQPDQAVAEEVELIADKRSNSASNDPERLSSYGFFTGDLHAQQPADDVIPYSVNSALFSDYAWKKRFFRVPKGTLMNYHPEDPMSFPEGSVLIKTFYYPADFRQPEKDHRLLETRLLIREKDSWKALTYVWNADQTDALLSVAGSSAKVEWIHSDGRPRSVNYLIPNQNQCKNCHQRGNAISPIGPTARQLNLDLEDGNNQLEKFSRSGLLKLPPAPWPQLADYNDSDASTGERARAWLEINCAHCHRPDGPAKTSGLHLLASITDPLQLGIGKAPVAAGKGSGGRAYDIVPGRPDKSILMYRVSSTDPGVMMPELGRTLVHQEGIELVRKWISEMSNK